MDINKVLNEYDSMFGNYTLPEIENFLSQKLAEAMSEKDSSAVFTLLNEMIGFCRDTMQKEKGLAYAGFLLRLIDSMELQGTVQYATTLLNVANAYRAFGKHEESLQLFQQTYQIYENYIPRNNFSYASLFNNWSLLYQEMGRFEDATKMLLLALEVVDLYPEAKIQQAVTRSNLASSMLEIGENNKIQEALPYIQQSLAIFEQDGGVDFHYGAALVVMGDYYFKIGVFEKAVDFYQRGLLEVEKHVGRNDNYMRVYEKYQNAIEKNTETVSWKSNLQRSYEFYATFGKKMIHEQFPDYESRIAVGMVGEGSDCFEFDDYISTDHDYAVGFCMWLTEQDYEVIGEALQRAYENLLRQHGCVRQNGNLLENRRGVCKIKDFYDGISEEDYRLAEVTNGKVFVDELGEFSRIRNQLLEYYPEPIWRKKLAKALHDFSQYAQSNYPRMMARKDSITANLCISKAVESAMDIIYLLNKVYSPYYKWKKKGLERLERLQAVLPLLEEVVLQGSQAKEWNEFVYASTKLNEKDAVVVSFEKIATMILNELVAQGLVNGSDTFLELYVEGILNGTSCR